MNFALATLTHDPKLEAIAASGPFIRGSEEWIRREQAREILGAVCVNIHEIPTHQAHGEPRAHLQQVDTSAYRDKVRAELGLKP